MDLKQTAKEINENAVAKGFWDNPAPNIAEKLMLIVSEVSEAMEADRKDHNAKDEYLRQLEKDGYTWENSAISFQTGFQRDIKNSFADELADAVIRILDLCHHKGIDLEWHIKMKMGYNSMREHMHGKKY